MCRKHNISVSRPFLFCISFLVSQSVRPDKEEIESFRKVRLKNKVRHSKQSKTEKTAKAKFAKN